MKRFSAITMAILCTIVANAQIDTLSTKEKVYELQGVVVEADLAVTSAESSKYYPSRKQKNVASDATSLLQHMMIPQLQVNPNSQSISTISGDEVSIFIDFMPATKEDLQGINTQDVKRVDIYDFPKDVRFQNKPHVVNFVMQKYEFGGYTKLTTSDMLMSGKDFQTGGSIYSKLAHKNWTFDANVSYNFIGQSHLGSDSEEIFNLPAQTIKRTELLENGSQDKGITSASLRATYNTEKIQLDNRLELLDNHTMKQDIFGNVTYVPILFNATNSSSHLTLREITPTYRGNWNFIFPKDWSLNLTPELMFMDNKTNRIYNEGENQPIENHIKEKMFYTTWQALLSKTFAEKHTLTLIHYGDTYNSRMNYSGSTIADCEVGILSLGQGARYSYSIPKFSFSTYFVYCYTRKNMGGFRQENWFPAANLSASFSPNNKNNLLFQFVLVNQQADGAKCNPTILKENELMHYCGNASLKDYSPMVFILQHTWMPSNKFTMATFARQFYYRNYFANVWTLYDDGATLLRNFDNVGNLNITSFGSSLTLRLLDGNLQFSATPKVNLYNITGIYDSRRTTCLLDLSASYYLGQFYFLSGYQTSEKSYDELAVAWQRARSQYYFTTGYGNAKWKAKLTISNPFRTDWRDYKTIIFAPLYSKISESFNASSHQRITFTLSYTFGYGKKVNQGNELGTASSGQSSIL